MLQPDYEGNKTTQCNEEVKYFPTLGEVTGNFFQEPYIF